MMDRLFLATVQRCSGSGSALDHIQMADVESLPAHPVIQESFVVSIGCH